MIRGTNRFTVEISSTGSPYFERAICFVRPQFSDGSRLSLHKAAKEMIKGLDRSIEPLSDFDREERTAPRGWLRSVPPWLTALAGALLGALLSLSVCLIVFK